jgi:hypothetical protein
MMHGREVRLRHSSWEADEQSRATGRGAGGAKGGRSVMSVPTAILCISKSDLLKFGGWVLSDACYRRVLRMACRIANFRGGPLDSICGENETFGCCCRILMDIEWAATKTTVSPSAAVTMTITPPRIE